MKLGTKIKSLRISRNLTQSQIAGDKITRNMLSAIEGNKATPSLDTLMYLADALSVPSSYLLSDDEDLFFYEKKENIKKIKTLYCEGKYEECLKVINSLSDSDDEIAYISCCSYYKLGSAAVIAGSLLTGKENLLESLNQCKQTIYDTKLIQASALIYLSIANNIQAPLLEFNSDEYVKILDTATNPEFYRYLMLDMDYEYKNRQYSLHIEAKNLIKSRRYLEAVSILRKIEEEKSPANYNSYVIFSVYTDLENCYRQLFDFENAYKYAAKRMNLIEAFKS